MGMKRKDFTLKKELKSRKRLDNGMNTMKRLSLEIKGTLCLVTSPLDTRHYITRSLYVNPMSSKSICTPPSHPPPPECWPV